MKAVKLKLNKQEARLMAENLSVLVQMVPERADYDPGDKGNYEWSTDRIPVGLVAELWHKYYTRLLACDPAGTVVMTMPEPYALAYRTCLVYFEVDLPSVDHAQLAHDTCSLIHQATL